MNQEFDDPQCPLHMMKATIDKKFQKIMSILNIKHSIPIAHHRRTQTVPNQSSKDDQSTIVQSKEPELSVKLMIPGFPLTSRNDTAIKQKTFNKTYTSRETLNKKRPNNSQLNTTNSTVQKASTDIAKVALEVKLEKRMAKPDETLKKKKVEQPHILKQQMIRVKTTSAMLGEMKQHIEKTLSKNRDQNQDSYIRRLKLLERIAKRTEPQIKK